MFSRRPVLRKEKDQSKDKKRRRQLAGRAAAANKHVVKFQLKEQSPLKKGTL
jgi:hypothetical protein